jgi:hypothetical protein
MQKIRIVIIDKCNGSQVFAESWFFILPATSLTTMADYNGV